MIRMLAEKGQPIRVVATRQPAQVHSEVDAAVAIASGIWWVGRLLFNMAADNIAERVARRLEGKGN